MDLVPAQPSSAQVLSHGARVLELNRNLPGYAGMLRVNGQTLPHSLVSLHRPTGTYVHRAVLHLVSRLLERGGIRMIGHAGAPGLIWPQLNAERGIAQIPIWPAGYLALAINVLGQASVRHGVTVPAQPFMVLDLNPSWASLDDYLGAMKTKYRTRAKRALTRSAHCECCECTDWPDADWLNWAAELLGKTLADKVIALPENLAELLATFKKIYGPDFHIFGYRTEGRWVGFITALHDGDCVYAMHMGYEPDVAREVQFYQRSMLDVVALGIRLRATQVNMGRTATEIKSTLGARPVENSFVIMTHFIWLRKLVERYCHLVLKLPDYELRAPFKNQDGDGPED